MFNFLDILRMIGYIGIFANYDARPGGVHIISSNKQVCLIIWNMGILSFAVNFWIHEGHYQLYGPSGVLQKIRWVSPYSRQSSPSTTIWHIFILRTRVQRSKHHVSVKALLDKLGIIWKWSWSRICIDARRSHVRPPRPRKRNLWASWEDWLLRRLPERFTRAHANKDHWTGGGNISWQESYRPIQIWWWICDGGKENCENEDGSRVEKHHQRGLC